MFKSLNQSFIYFLECVFILLIISILMLACWRNTSSVESTDPKDIQAYIPKEARSNREALMRAILSSKFLDAKYKNRPIDTLNITTKKGLKMSIPKEYIDYHPMKPDGAIPFLILRFYLPYMDSKKHMEARFALADKKTLEEALNSLEIITMVTNGTPPGTHPRQELFHAAIKDFQKSSGEIKNQPDAIQPLKNGKYDAKLNLVAYSGSKEIPWGNNSTVFINTIYLKPEADMNDPKEWIMCAEDVCIQCWAFNDHYVEAVSIPGGLFIHNFIQEKINFMLEEFTQYTPLQNIRKGIINFGHLIYHLIFSSFKRAT